MQSVVTGQAPITVSFLLCSIYTEYYEALLGWNTRSRCADQICYPYVRLTLWKGECRWAFDCSDTVMVYILRILFFGSAHILLGRWIDTNDHMYIENLAVNKKQFPPFCQRFGGGCTPFCHLPLIFLSIRFQHCKRSSSYWFPSRGRVSLWPLRSIHILCAVTTHEYTEYLISDIGQMPYAARLRAYSYSQFRLLYISRNVAHNVAGTLQGTV